jgi:hypothetical protein
VSEKLRGLIETEIKMLDQVLAHNNELLRRMGTGEPDWIRTQALAVQIHSFYMGVENIFKRISKEMEIELPDGKDWHIQLLNLMHREDFHGGVITEKLRLRLLEYLGFRHMMHHTYAFDLNWVKMKELSYRMDETFAELKNSLIEFTTRLEKKEEH